MKRLGIIAVAIVAAFAGRCVQVYFDRPLFHDLPTADAPCLFGWRPSFYIMDGTSSYAFFDSRWNFVVLVLRAPTEEGSVAPVSDRNSARIFPGAKREIEVRLLRSTCLIVHSDKRVSIPLGEKQAAALRTAWRRMQIDERLDLFHEASLLLREDGRDLEAAVPKR